MSLCSSRVYRLAVAFIVALALAPLSACQLDISDQAEAKDQWTRSYPLSATGTFSLKNSNGRIEVEAGDGATVEVSAERMVRAGTEDAARSQLAAWDMREEVSADRVSIDSSNRGGIMLHSSRRVNYKVRVPRSAAVALDTSNGDITIAGVGGALSAEASNGRITARGLQKSAKVSTTNGVIALDFASLAADGILADTTNGTITLTLPRSIGARLSARVTNGSISHENLDLTVSEQSRRRLDGTIGAGGPSIRLETTNGTIAIKGR